jgi:hypothetical protein
MPALAACLKAAQPQLCQLRQGAGGKRRELLPHVMLDSQRLQAAAAGYSRYGGLHSSQQSNGGEWAACCAEQGPCSCEWSAVPAAVQGLVGLEGTLSSIPPGTLAYQPSSSFQRMGVTQAENQASLPFPSLASRRQCGADWRPG